MKSEVGLSELKSRKVISRKKWSAVCAMVLMIAATQIAVSQTAPRANRITQEVTSGAIVTMAGSVHPMTRRATDLGAVNSEMQLDSMTLNIGLSAAQQADMNALLAAQQNPKSPQYHQWLTQEQYGARFGLTDSDLSKVTAWLTSQGFTVKRVALSRNTITFSGKAWQVESAFHTQLHRYQKDGQTHFANATELRIPAALASVVVHVGGLSSFRPRARAVSKKFSPDFTSDASGFHSLSPGDWATIYDVARIYNAGYTGAGMHVGIVGQTYFPQTDIDNFRSAAGLTATKLNMVCISSADCEDLAGESIGDMAEADMDVEWAGGIAKDATVDYIYASAADQNYDVVSALDYAINDYPVFLPVISMSYGMCESDLSGYATYQAAVDSDLQHAASRGQTILIAAGDQGAACDDNDITEVTASDQVQISWPTGSPYVVAVGGSEFTGDGIDGTGTGANSYWSYSSSQDIISSALQYIPESSWNDTAELQDFASGGGGVSSLYLHPAWQSTPSTYTGKSMRFVPDVSFSASSEQDPYLVCTQLFATNATIPSQTLGSTCVNGFRYSDGTLAHSYYGGTSAASPSFAGMLTLLVQALGNQGAFNSTLYSLAGNSTTYAAVFHDITAGTNMQPCITSVAGCSGGLVGYSGTTGYDLVTGLGSIDGYQLLTAMSPSLTTTTLSVSASPNPVTIGAAIKLTATVDFPDATGSVSFSLGSTNLGTATVTGGTGTLSTTATGFSAGLNTISATYSGNATYASSSGTTSVTANAVTTASYTLLTPNGTSSYAVTASGPVVLTLASTNYTGNVTLTPVVTTSNGTLADVTAVISSTNPVPLTATGTTTASSTLTITANASAANHSPAVPWKSGGALVFAIMLGAPFTLRRRRALAVLFTALAIMAAGFLMSCGGSSSSSSSGSKTTTARVYTITVTPSGSGTVTNPTPVVVTLTVQ